MTFQSSLSNTYQRDTASAETVSLFFSSCLRGRMCYFKAPQHPTPTVSCPPDYISVIYTAKTLKQRRMAATLQEQSTLDGQTAATLGEPTLSSTDQEIA